MLTEAEDERSIGNRLAAQENSSNPSKPSASNYDPEAELSKRNPEAPVCCFFLFLFFFFFFPGLVNSVRETGANDHCRLSCMDMNPPGAPRSTMTSRGMTSRDSGRKGLNK